MSRIPPALALRLDRLARRAHAFHRLAHHPLCARYRGEVVALGRRTRLCLGCTLAAAGLGGGQVLGALLALAAPPPAGLALAAGLLVLAAVPLALPAAPGAKVTVGEARGAGPKLLTRLLPGLLAGALLAQPLAPGPGCAWPAWPLRAGAAAAAALALAWALLRYRRRGPDRSPCLGCPEGPPGPRCPGYAPVARRERALSRLAGRWIAAAIRRGAPGGTAPPASRPGG